MPSIFVVVEGTLFKRMVLKLPHGPPLYKPPTRQALGGALLDAKMQTQPHTKKTCE
jgi:hypothetical protein